MPPNFAGSMIDPGGRSDAAPFVGLGSWFGWATVFGLILFSWVALWLMVALPSGEAGGFLAALAELCGQGVAGTSYGPTFLMWALMVAAMMLPTAVRALRDYHALAETTASAGQDLNPTTGFLAHAVGYLIVWLGFAAIAAGLHAILADLYLIDGLGRSTSFALTGILLAIAAAWQFSPIKDACLTACRHPMTTFLAGWRPTLGFAFRSGVSLGAVCVGCCWALMLLGFAGGVMSLLWMGAATLFMTLEKLPDIGKHLSRPLGVALSLASLFCFGAVGAELILI